jgi:hypothetical protein
VVTEPRALVGQEAPGALVSHRQFPVLQLFVLAAVAQAILMGLVVLAATVEAAQVQPQQPHQQTEPPILAAEAVAAARPGLALRADPESLF